MTDEGYEGVTVAGLAVVAGDSGRVLLARRSFDETDDPEVQETWEFPGGHLSGDEDPQAAAFREFEEEVGVAVPPGEVDGGWRSADGHYQGFVYRVPTEIDLSEWTETKEVQGIGWFTRTMVDQMSDLRPEVRAQADWDMIFGVSGNEGDMTDEIDEAAEYAAIEVGPIPVHGVVAPEERPTGDQRGFAKGSMTKRPLRLPLRDTATDVGAHGGAFVVGSVDRLMRADGMVQFEGLLMPGPSEPLIEKMQFFDGRYGVSVDGDQGSVDSKRTEAEQVLWFDQIRAAGLTAVDIPAFHEAYVAFGPHPTMPSEEDGALAASAYDSGDLIGARSLEFKRGPGWVTNPRETSRIHRYWTEKGQEGYAKIAWGTPGDFRRAKALIGAKIAANSPEKMRFLNRIIAQWHFDALGYWPGDLGKPGNAPDTPENRRRAARHAKARLELIRAAVQEMDSDVSDDFEIEPTDDEEAAWEAVLVSSAATGSKRPPLDYFHYRETGAVEIDEPDENGFRRVSGYAAEWGVCHIGMNGICVEPPRTYSDDYPDFHLGRTKTRDGLIYTGLLTYGVEHRDSDTILSESVQKCYFDNIRNAWAAVRVGEDDIGIWFSGVVLPHVPEEDLTLIEASGQVSGEWLHGEMRACLTVGIPGFPIKRPSASYDDQGNVVALAASAFNNWQCGESPADRLAAIRTILNEERLDALRKQFYAERVV